MHIHVQVNVPIYLYMNTLHPAMLVYTCIIIFTFTAHSTSDTHYHVHHLMYVQVNPPMPSRLSLKLSLLLGADNSNC